MCGRYSESAGLDEVRLTFRAEPERPLAFTPQFNIAPSFGPGYEQLFVVGSEAEGRAIRLGRFWFIPSFWNRPLKDLPTSFNARAEDLDRRRFFRHAFREQRCLVPATGWREFRGQKGKKEAFHFHLDQHVFALAGLWSTWQPSREERVYSFAIITTESNELARQVHPRMPLVMPRELYGAWLDVKADGRRVLGEAVKASSLQTLHVYPSDTRANDPRFEGTEAIRAVGPELSVP